MKFNIETEMTGNEKDSVVTTATADNTRFHSVYYNPGVY
jgi:hypothetical protein